MSNYSLPSAPLLLLVTDRTRYADRSIDDVFVPALAGGVNMIELRETDMTARDLLGEAERLRKLALGGVPLVIYDRVDVAVAARADGVHVTADSLPIAAAKQAGRGVLVGKSVTSVAEAAAADLYYAEGRHAAIDRCHRGGPAGDVTQEKLRGR